MINSELKVVASKELEEEIKNERCSGSGNPQDNTESIRQNSEKIHIPEPRP